MYIKVSRGDDAIRSQRYAVQHSVVDADNLDASVRVLTPSILRRTPGTGNF